ncbi:uncharacterized protein HD556DRAFT_1451540 [Suillus plorans]|uniref:Uncharacterized protein n=1 Tax=Suillus plorans TaxID=116603 RepID=A0A9P7DA48_9AGAM|nr:uncharacterized protein HD556DRAFT_1451540 [Suillus plorans]KAG1784653.1 hypothetical protein HD556DRAFT_1451540 [Suillus plorans]
MVKAISGVRVMTVQFKSELVHNITITLDARMRDVPAQTAIDRLAQTRKIIVRANGQDAVTGSNSFSMFPSHGRCSSSDRRKRNIYLATVEIMKLENLIILQNKVDLIKVAKARAHQKSIAAFVKDTISVQLKYNIDAVNEYVVKGTLIATS